MEKIKLLHISETFVSGVYTYIKQICNYLENDERFEIHIIYSGDRGETKFDQISSDFSSKIFFHQISMKREISPKEDLKSIFNIRKKIKEIAPDLIHIHSSKAGVLGRLAAFRLKNKVFYTPHGYSFLREDISEFKQKLFYQIEKFSQFFFPVQIIACGDHEFRIASKIDNNRACLILNGVNLSYFDNKSFNSNKSSKIRIGNSGRISIQKNPRLFNLIAKEFPNYEFFWIGDGDLKHELNSPNISITGWKKYDECIDILNSFDIFLSTSLWEGLPFNILEAMALKKPIITNNIESNLITVKEGVNGYICSTIDQFNNSIKKTILSKEEMGEASYKRVKDLFNQEKNLDKLIKYYIDSLKD
ncbi:MULTISPECIES: glycosyltransferase [unclassified Empedobacter]|uniref:glycosyltransferase n=1 Tax=unclassified Empedobacter TaxID=2643773 RepID=UPI00244B4F7E|nr:MULTISPECIES: glycosyltransferase [unclassified Empedobacter]MDH0660729.1 glycosyltransferase [Empedobacter sp. GD03865]